MLGMTIDDLRDVVHEASSLMLTDTFDITEKGSSENIVTSSDVAVQDFLCSSLAKLMPGCGFLCEEEDAHDLSHEYIWIIDPIDGTANYARGIAQCAICVGLWHNGKIEMSVVYLPRTGEMFWAERGKGAWLGEKRIHVSDRPFANSILSTALPVYRKEYTTLCSNIITAAFMQINDVRRFGAAAPELCYLAMGRTELYFEYVLSPWDFAAASLIVEEAGGYLCRPDGGQLDFFSPSGVLAANSEESLKKLSEISKKHIELAQQAEK